MTFCMTSMMSFFNRMKFWLNAKDIFEMVKNTKEVTITEVKIL